MPKYEISNNIAVGNIFVYHILLGTYFVH